MASKVNGHTKRSPAAAAQESIYKLVRFVIHRIFTLYFISFFHVPAASTFAGSPAPRPFPLPHKNLVPRWWR